jgi:hypothetical protein
MPTVEFEPTNSAGERPQTYALDRAATGTGFSYHVVYLFSWRYNPFGCIFHSPVAGFSLHIRGFLIIHNDAPQSVGLLLTSDQSVAETST